MRNGILKRFWWRPGNGREVVRSIVERTIFDLCPRIANKTLTRYSKALYRAQHAGNQIGKEETRREEMRGVGGRERETSSNGGDATATAAGGGGGFGRVRVGYSILYA